MVDGNNEYTVVSIEINGAPVPIQTRPEAIARAREAIAAGPFGHMVAGLSPGSHPKHPAGITCKRCLVTSERGDQHLETCTARDFAPSDRNLTSAQWTSRVTARLELREARRQYAARPFVPDISDEELFGRPVR